MISFARYHGAMRNTLVVLLLAAAAAAQTRKVVEKTEDLTGALKPPALELIVFEPAASPAR